MSIGNNNNTKSPYVTVIQLLIASLLGGGGVAVTQFVNTNEYINDKIYRDINKQCQEYYREKVERQYDFKLEKLRSEMFSQLQKMNNDMVTADSKILSSIPPRPLRRRILAIEDYLKSEGKGYKVPIYDWN